MIAAIVHKEVLGLVRDRRVLVLGLALLAMLLAAYLTVLGQQQRLKAERAEVGETARVQWEKQGIKHPHRGAHFGIYAFRPQTPLAAFDPGIEPYVGQAIWLEPHRRNMARFHPAADAGPSVRFGSMVPGFLLTTLFPLLIMALAFNQITLERDQGTLRMLQSMGASNLAILGGKLIAIAACLLVAFLPVFIVVAMGAVWQSGGIASLSRVALLWLTYLTYYLITATVGLALGVVCRGSRGGLFLLVVVWAVFVLAAPRLGGAIAQKAVPLPLAGQFWAVIERDYKEGLPGDPGLAAQVRRFEADLLRNYGVALLEHVPIGVNAARRLLRDAYADKVHAYHFDALWDRYARQQDVRRWAVMLSPAIALRSVSSALSGTSLGHQRHFESAAEQYRRYFNTAIDQWDMRHTHGQVPYESQYAADSVWQSIRPFEYESPSLWFSVREAAVDTALLGAWAGAALAMLWFAARRLTP